ncbi:MAG TPA: O-succinylhomoserine sulfhydrylase [Gammaproteobacteria bacterium]|nr:O-succinylhomoserine sulfhydrylase [Gammaproteobacteria bacterium]
MHEADPALTSLDTLAVRAGGCRTGEGEHSEAIFATSSFVFASAAQAAARFAGEEPGNIYSRFTNPTVRAFEQRLAAMEGAEACVGTASGMGAITATLLALLGQGDHIVASEGLFGTTTGLLGNHLPRFGIAVSLVPPGDLDAWRAAMRPQTRLLLAETPTNPLTQLVDIAALAELAHAHDALLAIDNCFCTPALQRPLALGADLVLHSATKYLDGQGRCLGGAVCGPAEVVTERIFPFLRSSGITMSPFNAWVFLKGLETLPLRMRAHCQNALELAQWLTGQEAVHRVHFPGLATHPQHALAVAQQSGPGAIVSFELADRAAAWRVIDAVQLLSITANLGDTRSTITHPASTTHGRLGDQVRARQGIGEGLVRVSVGLESPTDLQADLAQAFVRAQVA